MDSIQTPEKSWNKPLGQKADDILKQDAIGINSAVLMASIQDDDERMLAQIGYKQVRSVEC